MNVSKVQSLSFLNILKRNNTDTSKYQTSFGLRMTSPLDRDTVSFRATPKFNSKTSGVSLDTAKKIHETIKLYQKDIMILIDTLFGDMVATEIRPKGAIYAIKNRAKSPLSIKEKSATRQWNNTKEILEFMTDLNGVKIEMRNADKNNVDLMLNRLIPAIRSRDVEVVEIENKRPILVSGLSEDKASKYDYASIDLLENIIGIQEEVWNGKGCIGKEKLVLQNLYNDFTDANYCALHILLRTTGKNARIFELQIMGKDVADAKKIDDLVWKILNGKDIEKKYNPIAKILQPFAETSAKANEYKKQLLEENPKLRAEQVTLKMIMQKTKDEEFKQALKELIQLNDYRGDVFIFQRKKEPSSFSAKAMKTRFLPLTSDIDPRVDFNNLYEEVEKCDLYSQKLKKAALSKAKKTSKK